MSDMNRLQKSLGEANAIETKLQRRNMPGVFQNTDNAVDTGVGELESSNNIAIGAAVLGGLGLATAAGRRAMANRKAQKAASSTGGRRGGVGFGDLSEKQKVYQETAAKPVTSDNHLFRVFIISWYPLA